MPSLKQFPSQLISLPLIPRSRPPIPLQPIRNTLRKYQQISYHEISHPEYPRFKDYR
jgi:hypothetical protein